MVKNMQVGDNIYIHYDDFSVGYEICRIKEIENYDDESWLLHVDTILQTREGAKRTTFFVPKEPLNYIDKRFKECYGAYATLNEQAFVKWLGKYADRW